MININDINTTWVRTMLNRKSNNGTRLAAVGKRGTLTYLYEQYKIINSLPLNSRLADDVAEAIKNNYEESVMDTTSDILASCQTVRIRERQKGLVFDKEGKVSHAKETTSIVGIRTELDIWDSLSAAYVVRSSLSSRIDKLEQQRTVLTEKQEKSLLAAKARLAEVKAYIAKMELAYRNSLPMDSAECYDSEVEVREAMTQ